jgi:beta-glucanase (GH16 family)
LDYRNRLRGYFLVFMIVEALLLASCGHKVKASVTPPPSSTIPGWTLVWSDEFNLPDGSSPDASKWNLVTAGNGFGNEELESYTNRPQNAEIQNGNLVITALKESYTGADMVSHDYTSARLNSSNKFAQAYGRFEARIKIPYGQGMWPAFWLLGSDLSTKAWPTCGEIDIMENIGREPSAVHGTIHGPGYSGGKGIGSPFSFPDGRKFAEDFHVYAVEWSPNQIKFYVDNNLYATRTPADLPAGTKWVYDHPFFILLNLAVGGKWPGNPDATTVFPQQMLVDYVRVYKRSGS